MRIIVISLAALALPLVAYFGGKLAPCSLWNEIGVRPAWAVTCCCRTPGGQQCCNEQGVCAGMVWGCVCAP